MVGMGQAIRKGMLGMGNGERDGAKRMVGKGKRMGMMGRGKGREKGWLND